MVSVPLGDSEELRSATDIGVLVIPGREKRFKSSCTVSVYNTCEHLGTLSKYSPATYGTSISGGSDWREKVD